MQVSSVLDSSEVSSSSSQQTSKSTSCFAEVFLDASSSTDASSSSSTNSSNSTSVSSSSDDSLDEIVQEFMDLAKETPEQRLFNSWLGSQGISEADYKAMTPAQQQTLHDKFSLQLQEKLKDDATASFNVAIGAALCTPSTKTTLATASGTTSTTASTATSSTTSAS